MDAEAADDFAGPNDPDIPDDRIIDLLFGADDNFTYVAFVDSSDDEDDDEDDNEEPGTRGRGRPRGMDLEKLLSKSILRRWIERDRYTHGMIASKLREHFPDERGISTISVRRLAHRWGIKRTRPLPEDVEKAAVICAIAEVSDTGLIRCICKFDTTSYYFRSGKMPPASGKCTASY